jgi:hypothetical protein
MCLKRRQLPVTSVVVKASARALLRIINEIVTTHDQDGRCARLSLHAVHGAESMVVHNDVLRFKESLHDVINRTVLFGKPSKSDDIVQLTVETAPGGALFEATLRHNQDTGKFALAGDVSRINAYGTQSECVDGSAIKKFCYCKDLPHR